jgi:5-methylcytosine-specific restriction endonuclease McrA
MNREYWRQMNAKSYLKMSEGKVSRRNSIGRTEIEKAQKARDKSNLRSTRAKQARFDDELTSLVVAEAHDLRKLRNQLTNIEWHVDHIIPLKHSLVCGLHIWSNLRVIPKSINLHKGNKFAIYETS